MKNLMYLLLAALLVVNISFAQSGRNFKNSSTKNEVVTIKGTVTSVNHPVAMVKGSDGKDYEVRMGPVWYWKNNNLELKEKGNIEVKGELEKKGNKNLIYPYTLDQNGKTITLADNNGAPVWAKGKGNGNGNGKGMGMKHGNGNGKGMKHGQNHKDCGSCDKKDDCGM